MYDVAFSGLLRKSGFNSNKEYGNNGQCNPTYFTVGNLVQYLQKLEESGVRREDLLGNYVFLTAGACGPCRFGTYAKWSLQSRAVPRN